MTLRNVTLGAIAVASALIILFHPSRPDSMKLRGSMPPCSLTIWDMIHTGDPLCRPLVASPSV